MSVNSLKQQNVNDPNRVFLHFIVKIISFIVLTSFVLAIIQYLSNLTIAPYLKVEGLPNFKSLFMSFLPSTILSVLSVYLLLRYTPKYANIQSKFRFKWLIYWFFIFIAITVAHAIVIDSIATFTRDTEDSFRFIIGDGSNLDFFIFNIGKGLQDSAWITALSCFVYFIISYRHEIDSQRLKNAELSLHLNQARMDALTAQLNPHFLFNALHTVSALSHENPDRANAVIAQLGSILRVTLTRNDRFFIPLKEEIDFVKEYIEIEMVRFGDRLGCEWRIDVNTDLKEVPPFLLQPLVENAIKYGIKEDEGKTDLIIAVRLQGEHLVIEVSHHTQFPNRKNDNAHGLKIGIKNLTERLNTLYGVDQWLLEQSFENGRSNTMILIPESASAL
jgi:sensor histidine kinase YesM